VKAIAALRKSRKALVAGDLNIADLIAEGRR